MLVGAMSSYVGDNNNGYKDNVGRQTRFSVSGTTLKLMCGLTK